MHCVLPFSSVILTTAYPEIRPLNVHLMSTDCVPSLPGRLTMSASLKSETAEIATFCSTVLPFRFAGQVNRVNDSYNLSLSQKTSPLMTSLILLCQLKLVPAFWSAGSFECVVIFVFSIL